MERVAVIGKLKPGAEARAEDLIKEGPPFDPEGSGFERHAVFLSGKQIVFVFEGGRLDQLLHAVVGTPEVSTKLRDWEPLLEGMPTIAHSAYFWQRGNGCVEGSLPG
ncbi:MAG TPA: hypothetical protein VGJ34_11885 [Gaiellaceae bacterium]|jgi:hypothetical protein